MWRLKARKPIVFIEHFHVGLSLRSDVGIVGVERLLGEEQWRTQSDENTPQNVPHLCLSVGRRQNEVRARRDHIRGLTPLFQLLCRPGNVLLQVAL